MGKKSQCRHGSKNVSCTLVAQPCCITLALPSETIAIGKNGPKRLKKKKRVSRGTRATRAGGGEEEVNMCHGERNKAAARATIHQT
jgi:hypothetical protein